MVNQWIDDHVCLGGGKTINGTGRECISDKSRKEYNQAKDKGKGKVPAQADIKKESKYFFNKKKKDT